MDNVSGGIDLHAHTTASDGSLTPTELVRQARQIGLIALAVTDHDTIHGLGEAMDAAAESDLDLVPGVELSVEDDAGRFHLLGYLFDPNHDELQATLAEIRKSREARNAQMADKMARLGLPVTMDDVRAVAGEDAEVIARPHFAQALVQKGVVKTVQEAFDTYLANGKPLYMPKQILTAADAIALIHRAGGLAVMAHPGLVPLSEVALRNRIAALTKDSGLDGIEAYYSQHTAAQTERFLALASEIGLAATGGSDFHGAPKPHVPLGIVYDGQPASSQLLADLRARLGKEVSR